MFDVPGKAETIEAKFKEKFPDQTMVSLSVEPGLDIGWKNGEAVVYRDGVADGKTMPFRHAYESELHAIEDFLKPRTREAEDTSMIPTDLPGAGGKGNQDDDDVGMIPTS
jgi:hypothetical protein